jgi:dCTP deaminase
MLLSDGDLRFFIQQGRLVVRPLNEEISLQPASIDLHLSREIKWYINVPESVRVGDSPLMREFDIRQYGFVLQPGRFVLGSTLEWVEVPSFLTGRVEGKSTLGRLGILVHVTAGFIDPGFKGNITLELMNVGNVPILLEEGMCISQICFYELKSPSVRPYGSEGLGSKYQNSSGTVGPEGVKGVK